MICEKPLTLTAADSHEVIDAAQAAGVRLYPAHVVRYFPAYKAAYDAIQAGRIGEVAVARFFRQASSPAGAGWYRDVAHSGGVIMDLMVHDLDQARWLCGEVTSVYAVQNPPTVDGISPVNVAAHVTLTHDTGAISHCRATWGATGTTFQSGYPGRGVEWRPEVHVQRRHRLRRGVAGRRGRRRSADPGVDAGGESLSDAAS